MSLMPDEVDVFVTEATALDADVLSEMYARLLKTSGVRGLIRSDSLSIAAASFSVLEKRVRDGLRPRADELNGSDASDISTAKALIMLGARVIWKRSAVSAEIYDSIVSIFSDRGVHVPR